MRSRVPQQLLVGAAILAVALMLAVLREEPGAAQVNFRDPVVCDSSVAVSGNTAATTQLVALTAGQRIHVCGFILSGAGATTAKLVRGTGSNCATGTADLTASFELGDNTSVSFGNGVGTVVRLPVGEALCWTNSGAVQVSGLVTYAKL